MAGLVRVDSFYVPGSECRDLVARTCSCTGKYGEICQRYDQHSGEIKCCPYWYGLRIFLQQRYAAEVRTPEDAAQWMATHEMQETRYYEVMCLECPSVMSPGATRPR